MKALGATKTMQSMIKTRRAKNPRASTVRKNSGLEQIEEEDEEAAAAKLRKQEMFGPPVGFDWIKTPIYYEHVKNRKEVEVIKDTPMLGRFIKNIQD